MIGDVTVKLSHGTAERVDQIVEVLERIATALEAAADVEHLDDGPQG